MNQRRRGHAKPPYYPTGLVGNIFASIPSNEIPEDFDYLEYDLWTDYFKTSKSRSLALHAKHKEKWERAEKHKAFLEKVYG